jgi:hypothetical protein
VLIRHEALLIFRILVLVSLLARSCEGERRFLGFASMREEKEYQRIGADIFFGLSWLGDE